MPNDGIGEKLETIRNLLDIDAPHGAAEEETTLEEDVLNHNLYGMHIKELNDALSDDIPHVCIGWSALGDLSGVDSKETLASLYDSVWPDSKPKSKGQNVGQIWRFVSELNEGDYVIFAESAVFHIGKVTSGYTYDDSERDTQSPDYTNVRSVVWLKKDIARSELSEAFHKSLMTSMSIWTLNDYKGAVIDLLKGTYVKDEPTEEDISTLRNCLEVKLKPRVRTKHPLNFIIYGAPGTGKTYSTAEYALAIVRDKTVEEIKSIYDDREKLMTAYKSYVASKQIVFTTFHQSYGYEEFIQGLRPDTEAENLSFKVVDGVFKSVADVALNNPDKDYVIIIDEINRANISKVFGELITLIEDDKRWGEINELSATLQSGDPFAVPNNLYIVGTMNSADKSISLIDAALRRRFSFIEQRPDVSLVKDSTLRAVLKEMNLILADKLESTDLLVGHSYFMKKEVKDLCDIMNNSIIPLLYEYFYDQRKRVRGLLEDVISKTKAPLEIDDDAIGRLRVKMKAEVATDGSEPV